MDKSIVPPHPDKNLIQPALASALNLATLWRDCDNEMILDPKLASTEAEDDISEEALAPRLADTSARVYGPDDFTFLEDNMFNDESSEEKKH